MKKKGAFIFTVVLAALFAFSGCTGAGTHKSAAGTGSKAQSVTARQVSAVKGAPARETSLAQSEQPAAQVGEYAFSARSAKASSAAEEVVISTAQEFIAFADRCNEWADYSLNKAVYLANDLDFAGLEVAGIKIFGGTLYGGYHSLSNITLSGGGSEIALFGTVTSTGAVERLEVKGLTLDGGTGSYVGLAGRNYGVLSGITVSGAISGGRYVGGIAAYNGRSKIPGTDEYQKGLIVNCVNNAQLRGEADVGGIVGYNEGEIRAAQNTAAVYGKAAAANGTALNIGGIAGYSWGKISDCRNDGSVGGADALYVGGLVGMCAGDIYFSQNHGGIEGEKYAGGAVGYYGVLTENKKDLSDYFDGRDLEQIIKDFIAGEEGGEQAPQGVRSLTYLTNYGGVTAKSYAGGILGYTLAAGLPVKNSVSTGGVLASAGSYAGGIAGYAAGASIEGCLSAGKIEARGLGSGNYVGGICGWGETVRHCSSSAELAGGDYVGGISGHHEGELTACYTNAVVHAGAQSQLAGGIAGFAAAYDNAQNDFGGKVAGNYYVDGGTHAGGIGGISFGAFYGDAAARIESGSLASQGALSPDLAQSFTGGGYWTGGDKEPSYPVLYYLSHLQATAEFGDDVLLQATFDRHAERLQGLATEYARITYTVQFLEWNESKGELQPESFEPIASLRLYKGQSVTSAPDFVYARFSDGRWLYEGKQADYFVSFPLPDGAVTGNTLVYARYREIATTLAEPSGKILAEGVFDADTRVELMQTGDYYSLSFTLDGRAAAVNSVTVKFYVGDDADKYEVYAVNGARLEKTDFEVSGRYLRFTYHDGDSFTVQRKGAFAWPNWAWALTGGGIALCACALVLGAVLLAKKAGAKKRAKTK